MSDLIDVLLPHIGPGAVPGAVGLVARGEEVEVAVVGCLATDGAVPMGRDSLFRVASVTKPVVAAAVMMLVDDGRIALDDPIGTWLPELASPSVVRTPDSPIDDVVAADRPITVLDLLTSRAGWGFPSDFSLPAIAPLFEELGQGPLPPRTTPDEWIATLARVPLLYPPGEAWLYNTCSDIQGVLIARASGRPLDEFLAERVFEPLGMVDTGFAVPPGDQHRFVSLYRADPAGGVELVDPPDGLWSSPPTFPAGSGGLVSTVDDWLAFGRMLLADGTVAGRSLLSSASVRLMTTDHLTGPQREAGTLFLEGQGWGFGGSVDVEAVDPWNVPGRYGWIGGTGTTAHVVPSTGTVSLMFSQLEMADPTAPAIMRDFWRYAAAGPL